MVLLNLVFESDDFCDLFVYISNSKVWHCDISESLLYVYIRWSKSEIFMQY